MTERNALIQTKERARKPVIPTADPIPMPREATLTVLAAVSAKFAGVSVCLTLFNKHPFSTQGHITYHCIVLCRIEDYRGHRECIPHDMPPLIGVSITQPCVDRKDIVA